MLDLDREAQAMRTMMSLLLTQTPGQATYFWRRHIRTRTAGRTRRNVARHEENAQVRHFCSKKEDFATNRFRWLTGPRKGCGSDPPGAHAPGLASPVAAFARMRDFHVGARFQPARAPQSLQHL